MANYGDFQLELYLAGLSGGRPALPIGPDRLAERAQAALAPEVWSYVAGGAGT
jgi:lactate 2-monooxygenase